MIGAQMNRRIFRNIINPTRTSVTIAQSVGTDAGAQSDCLNARNTDVFQGGFVQDSGKSTSICVPKPSGGRCAVLTKVKFHFFS